MLKELLEALKVKFPDISEHILNRIAKSKANTVTTAEQVKTVVDGITLQQVIDSYADSRATEAQVTAVHNYETKHGLRDGVKIDNPASVSNPQPSQTTQPQGGAQQSSTDVLLAQLLESNKKLNERFDKLEGERSNASRRQQVSEITAKLPENLRKPYERIALDSLTDEQFESLKGELTTEVDGIAAGIKSQGAVFGRPNAPQGGTTKPNELTKEQEEAIAARTSSPTKDGQQPF